VLILELGFERHARHLVLEGVENSGTSRRKNQKRDIWNFGGISVLLSHDDRDANPLLLQQIKPKQCRTLALF